MKKHKLKYQLYLFQLIIFLIFFVFIGLTYQSFESQYKKDIDSNIQKELLFYKKRIASSIQSVTDQIKKQNDYFISIHSETLALLQENPNLDLFELKNDIKSKYLTSHTDVELFLIDKSYTVTKTTYEKDLGFNLSVVTESKQLLDKTTLDKKVYIADVISLDSLDMKYKLYSYSKLTDDTYLELGFIDATLINTITSLLTYQYSDKTKISIYAVSKNDKEYHYYPISVKDETLSKKEYFETFIKFPLDTLIDDNVINSVKNISQIDTVNGNIHTIYIPLYNEDMFGKLGFDNIVLELNVDITDKMAFIQNYKNILLFLLLITFLALSLFIFFVNKRFTHPIEVMLNSIKNSKKIDNQAIISRNNELSAISLKYNELYDRLSDEIELNKKLTLLDSLTQAYNRKAFDLKLSEVIYLHNRYQTMFSLILFDIDDFKSINDTYGHSAGDDVLKNLVTLVTQNIRDTDTLYRVGGEEFAIICTHTIASNAVDVAQKLRKKIESSLDLLQDKTITVSFGVAEVLEHDTLNSIYKRVDDALYHSKKNGKNKVTSY